MDPQKPVQLDPKLKEVYERVMGTTTSQSAPSTIPQTTSVAPQPQPQTIQPITPPQTTMSTTPADSPKSPVTAFVAKPSQKGLNFSFPLPLLVLFVILFLLGYTLFWLKFFKISLPFLPF